MLRFICALVLISAVIYGLNVGQDQKPAYKYCGKDVFLKNGIVSPYSFIYRLMLLGCKEKRSSEETKNMLSWFYKTGTGHLLSISGLHVGSIALLFYLFSGVVLYLVFGLFRRGDFPFFYVSLPLGFLISFFYVLYIGVEVPRLRSLIMLGLYMASFFIRHLKDRLLVFGIACSAVLFFIPGSIFSYSFYYSFLAVLGLMLFKPSGFVSASICVFVFILPLNVHASGSLDLSHIVSNAVAVPLFSLVYFPVQLLMIILVFLGQDWAVLIMDYATMAFVWVIKMLSGLSRFSELGLKHINVFECIYLYLVLLSLVAVFKSCHELNKKDCLKVYSTVLVLSLLFGVYHCSYLERDSILNIDVERIRSINGSGDVVLGVINSKAFILDTGPGGRSTSKALDKISRRKIKTVDYLFISHEHLDHIGGLEQFLFELDVKRIVTTRSMAKKMILEKKPLEVAVACRGSIVVLDDEHYFKFHTPYECSDPYHQELAFSLEMKDSRITFMSDLPPPVSNQVLKKIAKDKKGLSILQVPHHCSSRDNRARLLNALGFDAGFCTRHKSLLKSGLSNTDLGFPFFVTGLCGDLDLELKRDSIFVSSEKCENLLLRTPRS